MGLYIHIYVHTLIVKNKSMTDMYAVKLCILEKTSIKNLEVNYLYAFWIQTRFIHVYTMLAHDISEMMAFQFHLLQNN